MRPHRKHLAIALATGVYLVAVYVLDMFVPYGANINILYVAAVMTGFFVPGWRFTVIVASVVAALVVAEPFLSEPPPVIWMSLFNRGLALLAIGLSVLICLWHKSVIARLAYQKRFTQAIINASPVYHYLADVKNRRISYVSAHVGKLLGYNPDDLERLGEQFIPSVVHPDDLSYATKLFDDCATMKDGEIAHAEVRMQHQNGEYRCVLLRYSVFQRGIHGEPEFTIGAAMDITERRRMEERLRESESNLSRGHRLARIGTWRWDVRTNEVRWSDECFDLYGYQPGEVEPNYGLFLQHIHPEDRERVQAADEIALQSGVFDEEFRIISKSGEVHIMRSQGELQRDAAGEPIAMFGVQHDITEQKRSEQALRESEERYRILFDRMTEAFSFCEMVFDEQDQPVDWIFLNVNIAFERMTGRKNVIGKRATEIYPDIKMTHPELFELHGKVARTGEPAEIELWFEPLEVWFRASITSPMPGHFVSVFEDITARKRTEEALRESENRFRRIAEAMPIAISVNHRIGGEFLYVNAAGAAMFGGTPEVLLGRSVLDFYVDPSERAPLITAVERDGYVNEYELRIKRRDQTVWVMLNMRPITFEGQPAVIVGFYDITERKQVEEELRKSERRYRGLVESQNDLIIRVDPEGRFTFVNDAYCKKYGLHRDDVLGKQSYKPLVHPDDLHKAVEAVESLARPPHRAIIEQRTFTTEGERWVEWEDCAIRDEAGQIIEIQAVGRDIHDRKMAEAALRESENRFRHIAEGMPIAISVTHRTDGTILYANQSAGDMIGVPAGALIGRKITSFYADPAERITLLERLGREGHVTDYELRGVRNGLETWVMLSMRPMTFEGQPALITGFYDITERKRSEQALQESELRFRSLIETMGEGLCVADADEQIMLSNPAADHIFGLASGGLMGKQLPDYLTPESRQLVLEHTQRRKQGESSTYELEIVRPDGEHRLVLVTASPRLSETGAYVGAQGVFRDITDLKRAQGDLQNSRDELARINEQLAQNAAQSRQLAQDALLASRTKSAFLANMSHELRTPMNGIIGFSQLLMEERLTSSQAEYVHTIHSSAEALLRILNGILDLSKVESGRLELDETRFDLWEIVESTVDLFYPQALEKGLELHSAVSPHVPREMIGDPIRLRQVLTNLMGNAVKFTERGSITISAALEHNTADKSVVHFTVSDTGIGIPRDKLPVIFDRFTQADERPSRRYGGAGLGLAICKQLVEMMGGSIAVTSEPGTGSEFHFTAQFDLPRIDGAHSGRPRLAGLKVLVVDSNDVNRNLLRETLAGWHCEVTLATGGDPALELLLEAAHAEHPFAAVIISTGITDGSALRIIRQVLRSSHLDGLQVICITSRGNQNESNALRKLGCTEFLTRPIKQSRLFDMLHAVISPTPAPLNESDAQQPDRGWVSPPRVLVVEDHPVNQLLLMKLLQRNGVAADFAASGEHALDLLACERYDVVLMDVQMPEMDGYECTRRIRQGQHHSSIPIIAMTAHAMRGDREKCLAAGMNDYLSKPIHAADLYAKLSRWITEENIEH